MRHEIDNRGFLTLGMGSYAQKTAGANVHGARPFHMFRSCIVGCTVPACLGRSAFRRRSRVTRAAVRRRHRMHVKVGLCSLLWSHSLLPGRERANADLISTSDIGSFFGKFHEDEHVHPPKQDMQQRE